MPVRKRAENMFTYYFEYENLISIDVNGIHYDVISIITERGDERFICYRKHKVDDYDNWNLCCLSMYEPKYMGFDYDNWILNEKEIDILIDLLNKPILNKEEYKFGSLDFPSGWMYLLFGFVYNEMYDGYIDIKLPIPDYRKLLEDKVPKYEFADIYTDFDGTEDIEDLVPLYFTKDNLKYFLFFNDSNRAVRHFGFCRYTDRIDKNHICRLSMDSPGKILKEGGGTWIPDKKDTENLVEFLNGKVNEYPEFRNGWDLITCRYIAGQEIPGIRGLNGFIDALMPDYVEDLFDKKRGI